MTIYVDQLLDLKRWKFGASCHMATDGDPEDLHAFAVRIGLKRARYQTRASVPHYDLNDTMRQKAVAAGAVEISTRELIVRCQNRSSSRYPAGIPPDGT